MADHTEKPTETVWDSLLKMRNLPYGSVSYILDPELEAKTKDLVRRSAPALWQPQVHRVFLEEYQRWIASTRENIIRGLDGFPHAAFAAGTTEAFDKFYLQHRQRRPRIFAGEYMYHLAIAEKYFGEVCYLAQDLSDLSANDAVVISAPFADTGDIHPKMQELFARCESLGVPVMVDASYFGVCGGLFFDFSSPAIESLVFSLSKSFPVPHLRVGMRLSRQDRGDALDVYNNNNYVNRLAAAVGQGLLELQGPDAAWLRYRQAQYRFCQGLDVAVSGCVFFGIDRQDRYPEYNRGGWTNRLCYSRYLAQGQLPS